MEIGELCRLLLNEYGVRADELAPMTLGVGGSTYRVWSRDGEYVLKLADTNAMNRPELEPELCDFLCQRGIMASRFVRGRNGAFTTLCADGRLAHLQEFIEGGSFVQNTAPDWLMA